IVGVNGTIPISVTTSQVILGGISNAAQTIATNGRSTTTGDLAFSFGTGMVGGFLVGTASGSFLSSSGRDAATQKIAQAAFFKTAIARSVFGGLAGNLDTPGSMKSFTISQSGYGIGNDLYWRQLQLAMLNNHGGDVNCDDPNNKCGTSFRLL